MGKLTSRNTHIFTSCRTVIEFDRALPLMDPALLAQAAEAASRADFPMFDSFAQDVWNRYCNRHFSRFGERFGPDVNPNWEHAQPIPPDWFTRYFARSESEPDLNNPVYVPTPFGLHCSDPRCPFCNKIPPASEVAAESLLSPIDPHMYGRPGMPASNIEDPPGSDKSKEYPEHDQ